MGWNDKIVLSDIEQEILAEWYPDYIGDAYNHPNYEKIYLEALDRYAQRKIASAEAMEDR